MLYFEGDPHSSFRLRARDQEPVRRGQRARRVRDDRARAEGRGQPVGAVPVAARRSRCRARRSSPRWKARGRCWWKSRRWSTRCRAACRGGWRWVSTRSGWRCCWRYCIGTAASTPAATTSSSTPWAVCVSRNRQSDLGGTAGDQFIHQKTSRYRLNLLYLVKSGWLGNTAGPTRARERIKEAAQAGLCDRARSRPPTEPKQGIDGVKILAVDRVGPGPGAAARLASQPRVNRVTHQRLAGLSFE